MELVSNRDPNIQRFRKVFNGVDACGTSSSAGVLSPSLASMYLARGCDSGSALLYIIKFEAGYLSSLK